MGHTTEYGASRALASAFTAQLDAMLGVEADMARHPDDPELLHDFRVAIRRTRSLARVARPYLPKEIRGTWEREWRWLGRVTSARRDLDVLLVEIDDARATLPADCSRGLDELAARTEREQAAAQQMVVAALAGDRYAAIKHGWPRVLHEVSTSKRAKGLSAERMARTLERRAARQLDRRVSRVNGASPAHEIHDARKRVKRFRYTLDHFSDVLPKREVKAAIAATKQLQDDLGSFQDNEVHEQLVSDLLRSSPPLSAAATTAARALVDRYGERRVDFRHALDDQLARFRATAPA